MKKYIGQHFKDFRDRFKDHEHFQNLREDEYPSWYSSFLARFATACDRFQNENSHEMPNGGSNEILPLYFETNFEMHLETHPLKDFISAINVKQILKNIMKNADANYNLRNAEEIGPFARRAMIAITWSAVGRAGEIKHQCLNDWKYDAYLNVTDISWREMKTISKHAMPMVPDRHYPVCFYHAIGCYFALEDGLLRSPEMERSKKNVLFPSLQNVSNESVARKLGKMIKDNLPKDTPAEIAKKFSGKSLRSGGINTLARHREISTFNAASRTGHATSTSMDFYLDSSDTVRGIPGALAMHGYPSLNSRIALYSLEMLPKEPVDRFIEKIFAISIPKFQAKGSLYAVTRLAAAALIAHHNTVTRDLGYGNAVSIFLLEKAREARISEGSGYPLLTHEYLLEKWSCAVMESFQEASSEFNETSQTVAGIAKAMDETKTMLSKTHRMQVEQKNQIAKLSTDLADNQAALTYLRTEHVQLSHRFKATEAELQKANRKLAFIRTPDNSSERKRPAVENASSSIGSRSPSKRLHFDDGTTPGKGGLLSISEDTVQEEHVLAAFAATDDMVRRSVNSSLAAKSPHVQKAGRIRLEYIIEKMYKSNRLNPDDLKQSTVDGMMPSENSRLVYCLELVDFVITDDQRSLLRKNELPKEELRQTVQLVVDAAFKKLFEFEGKDPTVETKKSKGRCTKTVIGMGIRVLWYKKLIVDNTTDGCGVKAGTVQLIERAEYVKRETALNNPAVATRPEERMTAFFQAIPRVGITNLN